jgi:hypothetical protein
LRDTLEQIVRHYVDDHQDRARRELRYYAIQRTDEEAVRKAALAQLPNGKRHPHQYRVPRAALAESCDRLLLNLLQLRRAQDFDELFDLVGQIIGPIPGIGQLTIYDTALRLGARFGLSPDRVYLHAGTREGAHALGFSANRESVEKDELPPALTVLSARELEDFLCIYKARLARLSQSTSASDGSALTNRLTNRRPPGRREVEKPRS